jgi:hypothetical protein
MNHITGLTQHFYGSASKEFLATKCYIGNFMQPIYRSKKRRVIKKLNKIIMIQNLSCSPPKPIMKFSGINVGFMSLNLEKEEDEDQEMQSTREYLKLRCSHAP